MRGDFQDGSTSHAYTELPLIRAYSLGPRHTYLQNYQFVWSSTRQSNHRATASSCYPLNHRIFQRNYSPAQFLIFRIVPARSITTTVPQNRKVEQLRVYHIWERGTYPVYGSDIRSLLYWRAYGAWHFFYYLKIVPAGYMPWYPQR